MTRFISYFLILTLFFTQTLSAQYIDNTALIANEAFGNRTDCKRAILTTVAATIGAKLSSEIGSAYTKGDVDSIVHKVLHGLKGGLEGFIVGGNRDHALAGAMGSMVAECVAGVLIPNQVDAVDALANANNTNDSSAQKADHQKPDHKGSLTNTVVKSTPSYSALQIERAHGVAQLVTAIVGFSLGFDESCVNTAISCAETSLTYNHGAHVKRDGDKAVDEEEYQNLSEQEKETFVALAHTVSERYQTLMDEGIPHERAVAIVEQELVQSLYDRTAPGIQSACAGSLAKGGLIGIKALSKVGKLVYGLVNTNRRNFWLNTIKLCCLNY